MVCLVSCLITGQTGLYLQFWWDRNLKLEGPFLQVATVPWFQASVLICSGKMTGSKKGDRFGAVRGADRSYGYTYTLFCLHDQFSRFQELPDNCDNCDWGVPKLSEDVVRCLVQGRDKERVTRSCCIFCCQNCPNQQRLWIWYDAYKAICNSACHTCWLNHPIFVDVSWCYCCCCCCCCCCRCCSQPLIHRPRVASFGGLDEWFRGLRLGDDPGQMLWVEYLDINPTNMLKKDEKHSNNLFVVRIDPFG